MAWWESSGPARIPSDDGLVFPFRFSGSRRRLFAARSRPFQPPFCHVFPQASDVIVAVYYRRFNWLRVGDRILAAASCSDEQSSAPVDGRPPPLGIPKATARDGGSSRASGQIVYV